MTISATIQSPLGPASVLGIPAVPTAVVGGPAGIVHAGTAQAGWLDSLTLAASAAATPDFYRWMRVRITGGAGAGQERAILASRQNLAGYVADFRNTAEAGVTRPWVNFGSGTTIAIDDAAAPDGSLTADRLNVAVLNTRHARTVLLGGLDKTATFTWRLFAKKAGGALPYLVMAIANENNIAAADKFGATFDIEAGTRASGIGLNNGSGAIAASSIVAGAGGFFLCQITGSLNVAGTGNVLFSFGTAETLVHRAAPQPYLPADTTQAMHVWGAEIVVGADPGFHIPTASAAAVGVQVDRPWDVLPDATSSYEIFLPSPTAVGVLAQP